MIYLSVNDIAADVAGTAAVLGSISLGVLDGFSIADINPYLTTIMSLGGLIFLFFKIKNMKLRNQYQKMENKRLEKEIKENE